MQPPTLKLYRHTPTFLGMLLPPNERMLLASLQGRRVRQVVWDINAIYFVGAQTVKLEALADRPPAPDAEMYDEAPYISVHISDAAGPFYNQGEERYWYRVVARDIMIDRIELVRSYVGTPGSWFLRPDQLASTLKTVTPVDCGALVTTTLGVLPAVQFDHSFGFSYLPEIRFYSRAEVEAILSQQYELLTLD